MNRRPLILQHANRDDLHNEIHARPPEVLTAPMAITHIVMLTDVRQREASRAHLALLLQKSHHEPPGEQTTHLRVDLGAVRLRWELHTEFVTWTFSMRDLGDSSQALAPARALGQISEDWLSSLPGECLTCMDLWVRAGGNSDEALAKRMLREDMLVGSSLAGGQAGVFTDFSIHADGLSRFVLLADGLPPRQLGRLVQQLLEIETYRMAALLGLPAARQAAVALASAEHELASLAQAVRSAKPDTEPALLDRLTRLAGEVESQHAATHSRFSASSAYFELLDQRILQIGEQPLQGLQTIGEFIDRRLTPARKTCEWAARRQNALSERVSRASNLLRTRVEIEQQQSSQALLAALNKRQELQLKLQSTVEKLSVAAITYYVVGLVGYLLKGAHRLGVPLSPEIASALAIPIVASSVWWSLRRLHRSMFAH